MRVFWLSSSLKRIKFMEITKIFKSLFLWKVTALLMLLCAAILLINHKFFAAWTFSSLQVIIIISINGTFTLIEALHSRFIQADSLKDILRSLDLFQFGGMLVGLIAYCLYAYPQVLSDLTYNRPAFNGMVLVVLIGSALFTTYIHKRLYGTD